MANTLRNTYTILWSYIFKIGTFWWFCLLCLSLVVGCVLLLVQNTRQNVSLRRLFVWELLVVYVAAVLVCTVFSRGDYARTLDNVGKHINLDLMGTIVSRLRGSSGLRAEVLLNLVMLAPVGFLLPPGHGQTLQGYDSHRISTCDGHRAVANTACQRQL